MSPQVFRPGMPGAGRSVMAARGQKSGRHGGSGKCVACHKPADEQARIKDDLVAGVPLYRLAKQWGINRESLRNHRDRHLSPAEVPLRLARESNGQHRPTLDEVEELLAQGRRMYAAAAAVQNMPLSLKAGHLILAALELKARMTRELDERAQVTVINVMQSPAYIRVRSIIFEELESVPDIRHRISLRLRAAADSIPDEAS